MTQNLEIQNMTTPLLFQVIQELNFLFFSFQTFSQGPNIASRTNNDPKTTSIGPVGDFFLWSQSQIA